MFHRKGTREMIEQMTFGDRAWWVILRFGRMASACVTLVVAPLLLGQAPTPGAASPGDIHGRVVDENGSGISGAVVNLAGQTVPSSSSKAYTPFMLKTRAASDGSFQFSFLAAGRYVVCVEPIGNLVDHCMWTPQPPVDLARGQSMALAPLRVEKGHWLQIRLVDPNGYLEQNENKTANANLLVGVSTPNGVFLTSRSKLATGGGKDLEVLVPFSTPFQVRIQSTFYKLSGANGTATPGQGASSAAPSQIAAGTLPQSVPPIVVNVVGLQ